LRIRILLCGTPLITPLRCNSSYVAGRAGDEKPNIFSLNSR